MQGDRLRLSAPKGVLDDQLTAELASRKAELLAFLQEEELPSRPRPRTATPGDMAEAPLSFNQLRLWFLHRLEPDSAAYNIPEAIRLGGRLDIAALAAAVAAVAGRHPALRTTFGARDDEPVQIVAPTLAVRLPTIDLAGLPPGRRAAEARRWASQEALRPFDLAAGPLLRIALLRLEEEEHWLLLTVHHIVADGWSMAIVLRELVALYEAARTARPAPLAALDLAYADFARWQRTWLQGEILARQVDFWRQRLAGSPALLELPGDRPRPLAMSYRGDDLPVAASPGLSAAVQQLSQRRGVTLFTTLVAAFNVLLLRYTGRDDLLVGLPVAYRNWPDLEGVVGFFANTVVLRSDLAGDPPFGELLGRVRKGLAEVFDHQDAPFEKLVEELRPERSLGHSPIFQVAFSMQIHPREEMVVEGLTFEPLPLRSGTARFDLALFLADSGRLSGSLEYSTDLFDRPTIQRLWEHLAALLAGAAADPATPLSLLPLLTPPERQQILEWNDTGSARAGGADLIAGLAAQVRRSPAAPAARFRSREMSFAELDEKANRLAHHLEALGIGPERLVGIYLDRSPLLLIAMLAVLKSGGAYLPLDPSYPAERLELLLADAAPPVLISQRRLAGRLPFPAAGTVLLDADWPAISERRPQPPARRHTGENLAYVIYTSGSTGRPKGVGVPHRALANFIAAMDGELGLGAGDRMLAVTAVSFDIAALELYLPLLSGACVELVERETAADGPRLRERLEASGATVMQATPSTWRMLIEAGWTGSSTLKVLVGGESLPLDLATALAERSHGVWNLYGPTETTVWSTTDRRPDGGGPVSIGRPIANTDVHLLDAGMRPVPVRVPGELSIGGHGVARGYCGRPDLTAERFVPDAVSGRPGARLYRTGDLVRRSPDGRLEFLGRTDHQIKVRGFRVEPGEIEAVLTSHPDVREAVVVARERTSGDQRLIAYVVPAEGVAPSPAALRELARTKLPEYMVPSLFVSLAALPLTPNRKIDRRALPEPEAQAGEAAARVAPRTPTEELLAGIWAECLGVERVGVHESFFDLGGHSLLAVRLVARMESALGLSLPLRAMFEDPTIASFAHRVERLLRGGPVAGERPALQAAPRGAALPLSFAQERLWFIDQLEPGGSAYNIAVPIRARGDLLAGALAQSVAAVMRRHEALRTIFAVHHGRPAQEIVPPPAVALPLLDLGGLPEGLRDQEARRLVADWVRRPFDLSRGPLFQVFLVRLGTGDHLVVVRTHHIVFDGSFEPFLRELSAHYLAFAAGRPPSLPSLPVQYADFASWQRQWLQGAVRERQLSYWRERLAGAPEVLDLPLDRPRPAVRRSRGARRRCALGQELGSRLAEVCHSEKVTPFMAALAAVLVLLQRSTQQDDISVGSPFTDRPAPELEGVIGCFGNNLVLRTHLGGDPTWRELLARVREACLGAYAHKDVPFELVVEALRPQRSLSHSPLFQVMFVLVPSGAATELPGLALVTEPQEPGGARFDLLLGLRAGRERLELTVEFDRDLFDAASIVRLAGHFENALRDLIERSAGRLSDLPLLTPAERAQILGEWNDTRRSWDTDACLHELFEVQVARAPEAPAVVGSERVLTYRETNARANQLARCLASRGARPGSLVAVHLERSPDMVVAVLGILKTGAAYVPLDPLYPEARIAWILKALGIRHLVTQRARLPAVERLLPQTALTDVICLDDADGVELGEVRLWDRDRLDSAGSGDLGVRVGANQLVYVIFTSGTTGTPKGVAVRHRPVINLIHWIGEAFAVGPADQLLFVTSLSFDLSVYDIFGTLAAGASVRVASDAEVRDPESLLHILATEPITFWDSAPAALQQILPFLPADRAPIPGGESLRLVFLSGDWVPVALPDQVRDSFPHARVIALGGATEAAIWSNYHPVAEVAPEWVSIPYGRPIPNARYHVLDAAFDPCPIRVEGDLYIGGECLADGYVNDSALTAGKYVPDPFGERPGGRLYRTGDRARYWPDGTLEFLGRRDQQVKSRGFRIELGEIESVLARHPAVREAVVMLRPGAGGQGHLVAYLVPRTEATSAELRAHLAEHLPEYMLPSVFVPLPALPLTANGKIDRKALPAPAGAEPQDVAAPRTPLEELLAGVFSEVLGLRTVGIHQSFFELGGHSLLATQVAARVQRALGLDLSLRRLFEQPTVAALATSLETARREMTEASAPPLVRVPRGGPLPLSFAQQRLWFLDQLQPGSPAYNLPVALRIRGELDAAALAASLAGVVRRHESLRTVFGDFAGDPVQIVLPPDEMPLLSIDLTALPAAERAAEERRRIAAEALQPFDLGLGPILRAALLRLNEQEHVLLLTAHHIASDGWSMGILVHEVAALYQARAGCPAPLPDLPVQYADFAVWQRGWLKDAELERQLAFWRRELGQAPPVLELPIDRPAPLVPSQRGDSRALVLPQELGASLEALGARRGSTLWMTVLAAFQALLHRYSGMVDLTVGMPVASRNRVELEGLIGFFVNTLVLRADLSGDPTVEELLGRVRERVLDANAHQDVPFEKLVEELQPDRDLRHSPLFQVVFAPIDATRDAVHIPGLVLEPAGVPSQTARVALALEVVKTAERFSASLTYSVDLFDPPTIVRLAEHLRTLLASMAADPGRHVSMLDLLSAEERRQLLGEWSRSQDPAPEDGRCVHALIADWTRERPETPAAFFEGKSLSYGELERRAGHLAGHLRRLGVGPEVRVALALDPSFDLVVALLGILKAGGVYVPVDPAYPPERQMLLLMDAKTPVLLTRRELAARLADLPAEILFVDELEAAPAASGPVWLPTLQNAAYVIYTSGSAGRPKGVVALHGGLVNFTRAMIAEVGLAPGDRFLQFASLSFDASLVQIFPALASGATLVLHRNPRVLSSTELLQFCTETGVTVLDLPAALWRQWVGDLKSSGGGPQAPIRMFMTGGESVPGDLLREWAVWADAGSRFLSSYGPTEATITSTLFATSREEGMRFAEPLVPLGRPLAGVRVFLLDGKGEPVPVGMPGELFVGGTGVTRGYLESPRLTATRFLPDPFGGEPGARLYRTGDRVRRLADGRLQFLGRVDDQIKIRGYRIELGEIEAQLEGYPAVHLAAVLARESRSGEKRLIAYVQPRGENGVTGAELREMLRARLPEHMVPANVVLLEAMPLTPTGKVDRRSLASREEDLQPRTHLSYAAPEGELEAQIARIWQEVLEVEKVGRNDNFFDLGGHSLIIVQVQRRLRELLGRDVPMVDLFRAPTVAALARHLGAREEGETPSAVLEGDERADARRGSRQRRSRRRAEGRSADEGI